MRKNSKIFGLIACSAVLAGAVAMGASNVNVAPAAAEGEVAPVTFEVAQQAQVNYEQAAIRFAATVSADYLATLGTTVKLVSSIDKMGGSDVAQTAEWVLKGDGATYVDGYATNTYYHSISFSDAELDKRAAAAVDLTATMWLVSDGVEVEGSKQEVTRSMRNVANTVYDQVDSDKQSDLAAYFGSRFTAKNAFKELSVILTSTAYGEEYTQAHWVVDGGKIADTVYKDNALVGADLELGTTDPGSYALWVGNDVYNVPSVTYVTNALEIAQEFNLMKVNGKTCSGYYAVVADMSVGGLGTKNTGIFDAVLDGNGHTVTVTKVPNYGIFGKANPGAVVKNLGINLNAFAAPTSTGAANRTVLFCALNGTHTAGDVKVENVYVKNNVTSSVGILTLIYATSSESIYYKVKDVIFDVGDDYTTTGFESKNCGLIFYYWNRMDSGLSSLENVNVIMSDKAISYTASGEATGGGIVCYAQNDKALRDAETTYELSGDYQYNAAEEGEDENMVAVGKVGLFGWQYVQADDGDVTAADGTTWKLVQIDKRVVNRYDDLTEMAADENAQLVGNWKVTADGVSWVNSGN